jgi:hypothetical protein
MQQHRLKMWTTGAAGEQIRHAITNRPTDRTGLVTRRVSSPKYIFTSFWLWIYDSWLRRHRSGSQSPNTVTAATVVAAGCQQDGLETQNVSSCSYCFFFLFLFLFFFHYTNVYFRFVRHVRTAMAATAEQARDATCLEPLRHTNCHVTTATSSPPTLCGAANGYQDGEVLGTIINSRIFIYLIINEIDRNFNK